MPLFNDLIKQLRDRHVALGNMADRRLADGYLRQTYSDCGLRMAIDRARSVAPRAGGAGSYFAAARNSWPRASMTRQRRSIAEPSEPKRRAVSNFVHPRPTPTPPPMTVEVVCHRLLLRIHHLRRHLDEPLIAADVECAIVLLARA